MSTKLVLAALAIAAGLFALTPPFVVFVFVPYMRWLMGVAACP